MRDPRFDQLADVLVNYSTSLQPGENVLVEASECPDELVIAVMRAAVAAGAYPYVDVLRSRIRREFIRSCSDPQIDLYGEIDKYRMERMQAYISIRGTTNISEASDIPTDKMRIYEEKYVKPVHFGVRIKHTKWVALRYPTPSMAQQAQMSTEAFEDFYFRVCTLDYRRMARALEPLKELMDRTKRVHVGGPGTDLTFEIEGIPTIPCAGDKNIPDGEIFTAPVRESVNGQIAFNARTLERGITFENIRLEFENGRIINATANNTAKLNEILDADEGARYVGEFAIGVNPYITEPMMDTLFDEKIAGSIHLTPGAAYEEADNGNQSSIHWDMVLLQTPDHGGGCIYFDGVLIRHDGEFVLDELKGLNPGELTKGE